MKYIKYFIFFYIIIYNNNALSSKIAVINLQELINKNKDFIVIMEKIFDEKKIFEKEYEKENLNINREYNEINDSRLILSESELNNKIYEYNNKVEILSLEINDFNEHYQNEIEKIKEKIINIIIDLCKKYADENKIDLIFDSTSYLLASNTIDITTFIMEKLDKTNIKLEYKSFE